MINQLIFSVCVKLNNFQLIFTLLFGLYKVSAGVLPKAGAKVVLTSSASTTFLS